MLSEPPPELLVVGGVTVDRFVDGSSAVGGSVTHIARAMRLDGRRTTIMTLAGPEGVVDAGLDELRAIAEVHVQRTSQSIGFDHRETPEGRQLTFAASAGALRLPALTVKPGAVLYAPVADELGADLGGQRYPEARTGAILQGWLRELRVGNRTKPIPLDRVPPELIQSLAELDLLVASIEDMAEHGDPPSLLRALRGVFGPAPALAVTAGSGGAWVEPPNGPLQHVPVARLLDGVPTVGAGDAFAAALLVALSRDVPMADAAAEASNLVAELLAERTGRRVHVVGDVHGMLEPLRATLHSGGLVDAGGHWSGGRDELWATGDLTDRGPDGIAVLDLFMRLGDEAAAAGGRVGSVLGNHEILLLAAREMPDRVSGGIGGTFRDDWLANGGRPEDLARLAPRHVEWVRQLPVAVRVGPALIIHADSSMYPSLGRSVPEAIRSVRATLATAQPDKWDLLLADFSERREFLDGQAAAALLSRWGGREVIHGHTPIKRLFADAGHDGPVRYAGGSAVAVDGGAYGGGEIVVHRVPPA